MAKTIEKFSQTLGRILKARSMQSRLYEYRIFSEWERTVGRAIALHARPSSLRGSKLMLVVDSPAWMQQLSLMKPQIREKLNAGLGRESVREITLRLGEVAAQDREEPSEERGGAALTPEEREKIEQHLHGVGDDDTRAMLRSLIEKDLRRKKRTNPARGSK